MSELSFFGSLSPVPLLPQINFYSRLGLKSFCEPCPLYLSTLGGPGVYVLLVPSTAWGPRQYRPIYFGESDDFSKRITTSHEHYWDWMREAGPAQVYVAYLWMYGSRQQDRLSTEQALIDWYKPPINGTTMLSSLRSLSPPLSPLPQAPMRSVFEFLKMAPPPSTSSVTSTSILAGLARLPISSTPSATGLISPPRPAAVRAFISFDYDHDADLRVLLVGQAKNPDTPFEIHDWSVKEPFRSDWKEKVREKIRRVDQVIVICGEHTDAAAGVAAELEIARQENKPYILLWGYKEKNCRKPGTARPEDKIYRWTWANLKDLIHGDR